MKSRFFKLIAGLSLLLTSSQLQATLIDYTVTDLGSNLWEYEYTVTNDSLAFDLEEFTIFFDHTLFGALSAPAAPAGWDPLVVQAPTIFNGDGFYDALALGAGIAPGESLAGFSVRALFAGQGVPGTNRFEVIDPRSFATIGPEGMTSPVPAVPLPAAAWLFASALLGLIGLGRQRNRAA